jgi:hypothetical protein
MTYTKECECGFLVSGRTENILKANMKKHKKSKNHKSQIKLREESQKK